MADETRAELRAPNQTAVIAVLDSISAGNANSSPAAGISTDEHWAWRASSKADRRGEAWQLNTVSWQKNAKLDLGFK